MNEIFLDISGFEGLYKISNLGRVLSVNRKTRHGRHKAHDKKVKERILKQSMTKNYKKVCLCDSKMNKHYRYIHRLVADAFLCKQDCNSALEVNHIDGNKLNNNSGNLEWVTKSQNQIHAYHVLKRNYYKKLSDNDVLFIIGLIKSGHSKKSIAEKYRVSLSLINMRISKIKKTYKDAIDTESKSLDEEVFGIN